MRKVHKRFAASLALLITVILCAFVGLVACGNLDVDSNGGGDNNNENNNTETYCIVVFNVNGGSTVEMQRVDLGQKVSRPVDPTREGFDFGGWYIDKDFVLEWIFDSYKVSEVSIVLYAKWTPVGGGEPVPIPDDECFVTLYPDNGTTFAPLKIKVGDKIADPHAVRAGYTLDGWYTDDGTKWNFDVDTVSGETLILRARWTLVQTEDNKCIVTFVTNCSATVNSQTIDVGGKVQQPDITNAGYTLDGWYNGDTKWDFNNTVSGATLTLTALWKANVIIGDGDEVTVTFNVGRDARMAGVYNPAAVTVKSGSTITEPQLTRSGYTVSGWYAEEGNTKWDFATKKVTENTTLFAKWTAGGAGGGGAVIDYTPTMTNNNTLYIHYLRSDNDYSGWAAWVWTTGNGARYSSNTVDKSGLVIAISLSTYGNPTSLKFKMGIIPEGGGSWGGEDGGDVTLNISNTQDVIGSKHWYISQGNTANGGTKPVAPTPIGGGGNSTTEPKRESQGGVVRSYAQGLSVMPTVSGWDEMGVGYQIFVASFCDSNNDGCGDLNGIIQKLDYLKGLNVDVLWLTPIQSSNSHHGYDCYDYYCIDPKFGTNADYRKLVSEAHKRGMKIIMDLVVNHTSQQNEWFQKSKAGVVEEVTYQDGTKKTVKYRDFYRWKNSGGNRMESAGDGWYFYSSFGGSMPELNYDYQPVRDAMVDVAKYWMSYGLDGFRMDAIKHVFMWDESDNAGGDVEGGDDDRPYNYNLTKNIEFFKEFNYKLKTKYPHCYLLGEQLSGNTNYVSPFYQGMDSLFDFNTYFDLPGRLGGGASAAEAQANAFNSNAQKYKTQRSDTPINSMISSNHDVNRLNAVIGGSTEKAKQYMAVIMTMPGLSWIYYGDEIGLAGKKGNDNDLRQSMKWTSSWANKCTVISDNGANNNTKSVAEQDSDDNSLLSYVKKLTKFRNDNPALINGEATCSTQDGMLKIVVTGGGKTYTVYHNFTGDSKSVSGNVLFGSSTVPAYGTTIVG